eukprot:208972-Rhodomonas_salina.1
MQQLGVNQGHGADEVQGEGDIGLEADQHANLCRNDTPMMGAAKGLKYPLFLAALYHTHSEMKLGPSKKKAEFIDLGTLSNPRSEWRKKCDELQFLPGQVTVYLQNYHARELGIQAFLRKASICCHNRSHGDLFAPQHFDLIQKLVTHKTTGGHLRIFHSMKIKHPVSDDLQAVRAYPCSDKKFHGKNQQDGVVSIPHTINISSFNLNKQEHQAVLEYGRVICFFTMQIAGSRTGTISCAFIKYFHRFELPDDPDVLMAFGCTRLYEPSPRAWYGVVPCGKILGRIPIIQDFGTPAIPYSLRTKQASVFPKGTADGPKDGTWQKNGQRKAEWMEHTGSKLFYVNSWAWTWGRAKNIDALLKLHEASPL